MLLVLVLGLWWLQIAPGPLDLASPREPMGEAQRPVGPDAAPRADAVPPGPEPAQDPARAVDDSQEPASPAPRSGLPGHGKSIQLVHASTGHPGAGLKVELRIGYRRSATTAFEATTDSRGLARLPRTDAPLAWIWIRLEPGYSLIHEVRDGALPSRLELPPIVDTEVRIEPDFADVLAAVFALTVNTPEDFYASLDRPTRWKLADGRSTLRREARHIPIESGRAQLRLPGGRETHLHLLSREDEQQDEEALLEYEHARTRGEDCVLQVRHLPQVRVRLRAAGGDPSKVQSLELFRLDGGRRTLISTRKPAAGQGVLCALPGRLRLEARGAGVQGSAEFAFVVGQTRSELELDIQACPDLRLRITGFDGEELTEAEAATLEVFCLQEGRLLRLSARSPVPGPAGRLRPEAGGLCLAQVPRLPLELVLRQHKGFSQGFGQLRLVKEQLEYKLRLRGGVPEELPGALDFVFAQLQADGARHFLVHRRVLDAHGRAHWVEVGSVQARQDQGRRRIVRGSLDYLPGPDASYRLTMLRLEKPLLSPLLPHPGR